MLYNALLNQCVCIAETICVGGFVRGCVLGTHESARRKRVWMNVNLCLPVFSRGRGSICVLYCGCVTLEDVEVGACGLYMHAHAHSRSPGRGYNKCIGEVRVRGFAHAYVCLCVYFCLFSCV